MKIKFIISFFLISVFAFSQRNECVNDVLKIADKYAKMDSVGAGSVHFENYKVINTDWEGNVVVSNIKLYKQNNYMHFFSEQGKIFRDETEVYTVLPMQKLVVLSTTNEKMNMARLGQDFFNYRKDFFDSCEVVSCIGYQQNPSQKILELKVKKNALGGINITKMIYHYDQKNLTINKLIVFYDKRYKIQKVEVVINEISSVTNYKFARARKYVMDKKGNLNAPYKGYTLMDNRKKKK